ncbi:MULTISPECIES: helix-turn-helix transcriptional regulator [Aquimarina]|uniref:helix-turn-helix transcriptional regulator n=1 Tax=Aquimarina TaxID=290174 RepID=UPI0009438C5C|nr:MULTISPECIES: AraC family transcriptional regulator [Aquimarina]
MIEINKVKTIKLSMLDGIELKSAMFIDKNFPSHFHQSWSLAHIEYGSENIAFDNSGFLVSKNAIQLIPPYSIHKNWGNKNNPWTYKALYISDDVIKSISKKINADYSHLASFPYFLSYCNSGFYINEASIFKIIENLFLDTLNDDEQSYSQKNANEPFDDILNYLFLNYNQSITLEILQQKFKVNKFKLQKSFKKNIGLTPLEYLTTIRIENSKKLFYTDVPLVEIALESGFYDQSHFTHSFKKYVGVTPGNYKRNSKILQDL